MWIDTHAHLSALDDGALAEVLSDARDSGVRLIVNTATDLRSAVTVLEQCNSHPMLRATVGISPFDVESLPTDWTHTLRDLAGSPSVVAIGEIGLDSTNPRYPPLTHQEPIFEAQLELATSLDIAAVVHSRGAEKRVADICAHFGNERVLFHCFTGDRDAARTIVEHGYSLSFSGILTFGGAALAELARDLPIDRLLVETDCPYLAPVPHRGKRNRPGWVRFVGEHLARLKGMPPEECAHRLRENYERLFGPPNASPPGPQAR